jgi:L-ascorbate metabolism protein UlaG (beta-lactamase superfamily)
MSFIQRNFLVLPAATLAVALLGLAPAAAQTQAAKPAAPAATVKITPLGSHDGEFCRNDRAMVFEDPDGTRILYDAGRTVRGPGDPRLGRIDAVLLSHVHVDHLGDVVPAAANEGSCATPGTSVKATPQSNTVNIVVGKNAKLFVGGEMAAFFNKKVLAAGGKAGQVELLRFGGVREIGKVAVYSVPAEHSNGLEHAFLDEAHGKALADNGLTAYVGPPGGFVVRFSNGLTAYLSGDTGQIAEQDLVVRRYFKANLAVMNIGGIFSTGPREAAHVMNAMVQPKAVIASHANEEATKGGKTVPTSKTATFAKAVKAPVYLPLSGKTMEFDGGGKCVKGCSK